MLADRGAAEGDDDVSGKGDGVADKRGNGTGVIADNAEIAGLAAEGRDQAARPTPFDATIWSGPGTSPGWTSSSPVAMDRDERTTAHRNRAVAHRRGERHFAHAEPGAGGEKDVPLPKSRPAVRTWRPG